MTAPFPSPKTSRPCAFCVSHAEIKQFYAYKNETKAGTYNYLGFICLYNDKDLRDESESNLTRIKVRLVQEMMMIHSPIFVIFF